MSLREWAKKEVEIACKKENPDRKDGEWDYGCACYESALKAFNVLLEDGHSGFSIGITKAILNRLIECKPLTPIEDTPDVWNKLCYEIDGCISYQCERMSSLFKYVYDDGTIKYTDINRSYCVDINNPDITYSSGLERRIVDEMFPIKMPYFPTEKGMKVYCESLLTDRKNGDFDTVGVLYAVMTTEGKTKTTIINRFFKEGDKEWIEIDMKEYTERKNMAVNRE